jgi:hypothetical protein
LYYRVTPSTVDNFEFINGRCIILVRNLMDMLTQEQRIEVCKVCNNRRVDYERGMLCDLTGEPPAFEEECPDFQLDPQRQLQQRQNAYAQAPMTTETKKDVAGDFIWGAIWLIGGLALTLGDTGAIFYGAIIYGAFRIISGVVGMSK